MDSDKDLNLSSLDDFMKQGVSYAVTNYGKIVAAITLIVAALAMFTNITFADLAGETFTISLVVMLISSYVMYFSLEDAGEKEGEECKEYTDAKRAFLETRKRILPDDIESLRNFCLDYSEKELSYRRKNFLCENGLTAADLESYKIGARFPKRVARILRTASNMKAVRLTAARLLSASHGAPRSELSPPERSKMFSTLLSLAPSTICTLFTVSIMLTTKSELSASTVIDGLIKLSALPMIGFKGFLDGYRYAKDVKSSWLETKTRVLQTFLLGRKE